MQKKNILLIAIILALYFSFANAACPETCGSCDDKDSCIYCKQNHYLESLGGGKLTCVSECSQGKFLNDFSVCVDCIVDKCDKCNGKVNQYCDYCQSGHYLKKNGQEKPTCQQCVEGCEVCLSKEKCTACFKEYSMILNNKDIQCVKDCPAGQGPSDFRVCTKCGVQNCNTCKSKGLSQCDSCKKGFYLQQNGEKKAICEQCSSNCDSCENIHNCLVCEYGYKLIKSENGGTTCQLIKCPLNHYVSEDLKCKKCSFENCSLCYISKGKACDVCIYGYTLALNEKGESFCKQCPENCSDCSSKGECKYCAIGYLAHTSETGNICVKTCPSGFYQGPYGNCIECEIKNCRKCDPYEQTCKSCKDGFYLATQDNKKQTCEACYEGCIWCQSVKKCYACDRGYLLLQKHNGDMTCAKDKCPEGFYTSYYGVCIMCPDDNCKKCDGDFFNTCSECMTGYKLKYSFWGDSSCVPEN